MNEIREKFNSYVNNEAPKQLEKMFDGLNENDEIMLQSCFEDFAELVLKQSPETGQVDAIVTLLHEKATVIEDRSIDNFKPSNLHEFHTQIDTARCLRVAANTLSGDQAG